MYEIIDPEKHTFVENRRRHVEYWDNLGKHCMEKECELNKRQVKSDE